MEKLSERLLSLARMVPAGSKVADIGTDHAFLPCYLVKQKIVSYAVGIDVNEGPFQIARQTVNDQNLSSLIDIRLGNGLLPLKAGEVDVVVIAGMGGSTMREILAQSPEIVRGLRKIIVQPMIGAEAIRFWLHEQGWVIIQEELIYEDKRVFQIIGAERGKEQDLNLMEACYGPLLIKQRHPLLKEIIAKDIKGLQEILDQLAKSNSREVKKKYGEFQEKMKMIKELYQWLLAVKL